MEKTRRGVEQSRKQQTHLTTDEAGTTQDKQTHQTTENTSPKQPTRRPGALAQGIFRVMPSNSGGVALLVLDALRALFCSCSGRGHAGILYSPSSYELPPFSRLLPRDQAPLLTHVTCKPQC